MATKLYSLIFALLISHQLQACDQTEQPNCIYEKHDMRFSYSDPWYVEEESGFLSNPYVFLETEDSGLIMVMLLPKSEAKTLAVFAEEYSKSANSQLFMGSFKSKGFTNITSKTNHHGVEEKLTLSMFGEEAAMTRQYFTFSSAEKNAYVIIQIDDEELADITGLEQVLSSFVFVNEPSEQSP